MYCYKDDEYDNGGYSRVAPGVGAPWLLDA